MEIMRLLEDLKRKLILSHELKIFNIFIIFNGIIS